MYTLWVSHRCMTITFIKLLHSTLTSCTKKNVYDHSVGDFCKLQVSLGNSQCTLAFEKLWKLLWYRNLFVFNSMFLQHCWQQEPVVTEKLWTSCGHTLRDIVPEHSWPAVPRPFTTWPALVSQLYLPLFSYIAATLNSSLVHAPVSHFLLSCYSRGFIICLKMGKKLSVPHFTPTIHFYLSHHLFLSIFLGPPKRDTWSISAPAFLLL